MTHTCQVFCASSYHMAQAKNGVTWCCRQDKHQAPCDACDTPDTVVEMPYAYRETYRRWTAKEEK